MKIRGNINLVIHIRLHYITIKIHFVIINCKIKEIKFCSKNTFYKKDISMNKYKNRNKVKYNS